MTTGAETKNSVLVPVLIAVGVIAVVVVAAVLYFSAQSNDLDCATENAQRAQEDRPLLDCD